MDHFTIYKKGRIEQMPLDSEVWTISTGTNLWKSSRTNMIKIDRNRISTTCRSVSLDYREHTIAVAILDRLVHTAHRMDIKGESIRKN